MSRAWMARGFGFVLAICVQCSLAAADVGSMLKSDDVRSEPFKDADVVSRLEKDARVEILKRQGGWLQVKSDDGVGWVRMLSVRRGQARKASGRDDADGLLDLAGGRTGTGQVVSTTGIRGLSEEELKGAKFNPGELKRLDGVVSNIDDARRFAYEAQLSAKRVEYLPEPQQPAQGGARR